MNKTLEGMARSICLAIWDHDYTPRDPLHPDARWLQAMKAAKAGAGFLADNVSDEMVDAATRALYGPANERCTPGAPAIIISAALRAAADGGEK